MVLKHTHPGAVVYSAQGYPTVGLIVFGRKSLTTAVAVDGNLEAHHV